MKIKKETKININLVENDNSSYNPLLSRLKELRVGDCHRCSVNEVFSSLFASDIQPEGGGAVNAEADGYYLLKAKDVIDLVNSIVKKSEDNEVDLNKRALDSAIEDILNRLDISTIQKGRKYIRSAIKLAVDDMELLDYLSKGLYMEIAEQFQTTAASVERAIRDAIDKSYKKTSQFYEDILGYKRQISGNRPSNGEFLTSVVHKLVTEAA